MKNEQKVLRNEARPFELEELFFSTTDKKGVISSCNQVFVRVSGFTSDELLGKPHNLIRHPHMPRCVFKLLWDYLLSERTIGAYVKNLAKTGEYYWVFALAAPCDGGFLSIRVKPTSPLLGVVEPLYRELLEIESSYGENWREGMAEASKILMEKLNSLGFDSYDAFMGYALHQEVLARKRALSVAQKGSDVEALSPDFIDKFEPSVGKFIRQRSSVFDSLEGLYSLKTALTAQQDFFVGLGRRISLSALNAGVRAAQLSEAGRALAVISDEVSRVAQTIQIDSAALTMSLKTVKESLQQAALSVSMSTLQIEMILAFQAEQRMYAEDVDQQRRLFGAPIKDLNVMLEKSIRVSSIRSIESLTCLSRALSDFMVVSDSLSKVLITIQFSYVTGKTLSASIEQGDRFSILLENMVGVSDEARGKLVTLESSSRPTLQLLNKWGLSHSYQVAAASSAQ